MPLDEKIKKGGPYPKKEQDERRKEVFHLHYEKNYPIVKIADMLNVNRNTISEDVKNLQSQFAEGWEVQNYSTWMTSHILRLESQKMRLLEEAEKTDNVKIKLGLEKMIFAIESKLGQVGIEFMKNKKQETVYEDPELEIKEIVKHLIGIKDRKDSLFTEEELDYEILKFKKCDELEADQFFENMKELGMSHFEILGKTLDDPEKYDLKKFADFRGYTV